MTDTDTAELVKRHRGQVTHYNYRASLGVLHSHEQLTDLAAKIKFHKTTADALEALQARVDELEAEKECLRHQCNTFRSESVAHLKAIASLREALEDARDAAKSAARQELIDQAHAAPLKIVRQAFFRVEPHVVNAIQQALAREPDTKEEKSDGKHRRT